MTDRSDNDRKWTRIGGTRHRGISRRAITRIGGLSSLTLMVLGLSRAAASVVTPAQIEGPFYPLDKPADTDLDLTWIKGHLKAAEGETILVRGRVLGADGKPLVDALVDVWQANHHGRYNHPEDPNAAPLDPDFQGQGLVRTGAEGDYGFKTIKPGPYSLEALGEEGWRCRHIHFKVSRSGFEPLTTQMYFRGDPLIPQDAEIRKAPAELRELLIADSSTDDATGLPLYRFDIMLANA